MSRISISETQFAFAFFHKYLLLNRDPKLIFVFPTLRQEGNPNSKYAGADLVINNNLFFQFKMPDFLRTRNAKEIYDGKLNRESRPYYRFFIKNSNPSNQFDMLKNTAKNPLNIVRYISPMFHTFRNQNDDEAFKKFFDLAPSESMNLICSIDFKQFVVPYNIHLSKDNSHKICYNSKSVNNDNMAYLFSEPKSIYAYKGITEFDNQRLVFDDNIEESNSINDTLNLIRKNFKVEKDFSGDLITEINILQTELIAKYDVFWIPLFQNKSKR